MQKYLIRPHHMLCLQFFEGKGYSDGFVENMLKIKKLLEKENPVVNIVEGADMICEECPHRRGNACKNEESVCGHDKRVYEQVIEKVGKQAHWSEITTAIYNNIIHAGIMKSTCGECRWSDICFKKQ